MDLKYKFAIFNLYFFAECYNTILLNVTTLLCTLLLSSATYAAEDNDEIITIDQLFELSLSELALVQVKVEVASLFVEDEKVVAASVLLIKPEEWRSSGARRTHEALEGQTGVVNYQTIHGSNILAIRGYATSNSIRGVAWMLDGVPLTSLAFGSTANTVANWELGTLKSMEVIKGPGSALYGSDAFHGVVSMKTFEPEDEQYSIQGSIGGPVFWNYNVQASKQFNSVFTVDFAFGASHQGDQNINYQYEDTVGGFGLPPKSGEGVRENSYDSYSGMVKLRINPTEQLKIRLGYYHSDWDYQGGTGTRSSFMHLREDDSWGNESRFEMLNAIASYDLGNNIIIEPSVYRWETERRQSIVGTRDLYEMAAEIPPLRILAIDEVETLPHERQNGLSVTLKQATNSWGLQWAVGLSTKDSEITSYKVNSHSYFTNSWGAFPFGKTPGTSEMEGLSRDVDSFFVQTKWAVIPDKLYIIAGGRIDDYSDFGKHQTPRAGVIYLPSSNSSVKLLYGQAFRAPVGVELTDSTALFKGNSNIQPEEVDVYELIYLHQADHWKLTFNSFYSKWSEGILNTTNPDYVPDSPPGSDASFSKLMSNSGVNNAFGIETEVRYSTQPFDFIVGFSYIQSEAEGITDPEELQNTIVQDYDIYPDYAFTLGIQYLYVPWGVKAYLNNKLLWGMNEYSSVLQTAERAPSSLSTYWRTDLTMSKKLSVNSELTFEVRDLFNRENYMPSVWGMINGVQEPGVSALLKLSYIF